MIPLQSLLALHSILYFHYKNSSIDKKICAFPYLDSFPVGGGAGIAIGPGHHPADREQLNGHLSDVIFEVIGRLLQRRSPTGQDRVVLGIVRSCNSPVKPQRPLRRHTHRNRSVRCARSGALRSPPSSWPATSSTRSPSSGFWCCSVLR
jgi:hypothetical protein